MKIAVCIKRVPATEAKLKIRPDGTSIDPAGVDYVLNPYDEYAVEEAIRLKEKNGGEVVVLCVGSPEAAAVIRTTLAMGADRGILITGGAADLGLDFLAVAHCLAAELRPIGPDVVFFGKQAVDDDDAAVGTATARLLGLPSVASITELEISGSAATVEREVEGGREKLTTPLPAVFTAQKGLNEPRYPSLKGIMAAKKKPIEEKQGTFTKPVSEVTGLALPPARPPGVIVGEGVEAVPRLVERLRNEAGII